MFVSETESVCPDGWGCIQANGRVTSTEKHLAVQTQNRKLTNGTGQGHDNLFPKWINGRIGDLGKELLEVVIEKWLEF